MIYLYDKSEVKENKKKITRITTFVSLSTVVLALLCIILVLFRKEIGNIASLLLCIIISSFAGCFIYYAITAKIIPLKNKNRFLEKTINKNGEVTQYIFISYKNQTETKGGLLFDVMLTKNQNERFFYILESVNKTNFNEGHTYSFLLVDSYIIGYQENE